MPFPIFVVILILPLLLSVVFAFTKGRRGTDTPLVNFFHNRPAGWGMLFITFVAAVTLVAQGIYHYGGCIGGLKAPPRCERIGEGLAVTSFGLFFMGQIYLLGLCLPTLILLGIAEYLTRRKTTGSK
ncbi:MAG: hypothetical protein AAFY03_10365 [Pseudomonadota bacterium]